MKTPQAGPDQRIMRARVDAYRRCLQESTARNAEQSQARMVATATAMTGPSVGTKGPQTVSVVAVLAKKQTQSR